MEKRNESNKKQRGQLQSSLVEMIAAVVAVVAVNVAGIYLFGRIDLTEDQRYSLSKQTKELLKEVDEPLQFRVYLEGDDLPAEFRRLRNETKDMLNQFRAYNRNVEYDFFNIADIEDEKEKAAAYRQLMEHDIQPSPIQVKTKNGMQQLVLLPAAEISYKGKKTYVQLLTSQKYVAADDEINNSVQNLEYQLSSAVRTLSRSRKPTVAFEIGHGELPSPNLYEIQRSLYEQYTLDTVTIGENIQSLRTTVKKDSSYSFAPKYDVLIIARPTEPFSERDLFVLDQYIMSGGRVLWFVDGVRADMDSLSKQPQMLAVANTLGLDDMFYRYGLRINSNLVMDIRCRPIPMVVGQMGDKPQYSFTPWYYFPDLIATSQHPIVRNLDVIKSDFASSIDLLQNEDDLQKTVLLTTSEYTRLKNAPVVIDLNEAKVEPDQRLYNHKEVPVAVLVEGKFTSMFHNRLTPDFASAPEIGYRDRSEDTKIIVVGDGDIIKNRFSAQERTTFPLGFDNYTQTLYANREFIMNAVNYLAGNDDVMATRGKSVQLRKLDMVKVEKSAALVKVVNVVLPALVMAAVAALVVVLRKRRWKKNTSGADNSDKGRKQLKRKK